MTESNKGTGRGRRRHRAGAFDVRNFIGALLALYGVILTVTGLVGTSSADIERSAGVNINLWAGIGLVIAAGVFLTWARLRPVVVPDQPEAAEE